MTEKETCNVDWKSPTEEELVWLERLRVPVLERKDSMIAIWFKERHL